MGIVSHDLLINGRNLCDLGVYVTSKKVYNAPKRDTEEVVVLGRNGTLTIDHGRYENVPVGYPSVIVDNYKDNIEALRNFIQTLRGYNRIEDTFNPDEYRMGKIPDNFEVDPKVYDNAATFEMVFNCMPQRFLKSGEHVVTFTSSGGIIRNPSPCESKPLITAYGTGTLTINGQTIKVNTADVYTVIDCEMQNCYKGSTNCNGNVTMTTGDFFTLASGNNTVNFSGFSKVEIIPKWWIL